MPRRNAHRVALASGRHPSRTWDGMIERKRLEGKKTRKRRLHSRSKWKQERKTASNWKGRKVPIPMRSLQAYWIKEKMQEEGKEPTWGSLWGCEHEQPLLPSSSLSLLPFDLFSTRKSPHSYGRGLLFIQPSISHNWSLDIFKIARSWYMTHSR